MVTPRYSILRRGTDLQPLDQRRRLLAAVRLDEPDHDVDAALLERVRLFQHAVGLADARREADVQLQPAALALLDELQEVFRARSVGGRCPASGRQGRSSGRIPSRLVPAWRATCRCETPWRVADALAPETPGSPRRARRSGRCNRSSWSRKRTSRGRSWFCPRPSASGSTARTLENLKTICDPAPGRSFRDFCRAPGIAGSAVPRLRRPCHDIARRHLSLPRR